MSARILAGLPRDSPPVEIVSDRLAPCTEEREHVFLHQGPNNFTYDLVMSPGFRIIVNFQKQRIEKQFGYLIGKNFDLVLMIRNQRIAILTKELVSNITRERMPRLACSTRLSIADY